MDSLYNPDAPKKATNLSVNSDLLKKSRDLNINLSATLEQALTAKLAESAASAWARVNERSIKAYSDFVEENGCFGEDERSF